MISNVALHGEMTLRAILRRRLTLAVLVLMPIVFYFVRNETVGQSIRSLVFGLSWALSTVAFFAAVSAKELEPRLHLVGWKRSQLLLGRLVGLAALGAFLTAAFGLLVAVDQDVSNLAGVVLDFAVTSVVAIALGTAIGAVLDRELEGTLVLFFFAGLQAVIDPFDSYSRALPFWSSRELGTYAVDGPEIGSLAAGLVHALITITVCAVVVAIATSGPASLGWRRPDAEEYLRVHD